jgi:hypothetical protein
MIIQLTDAGAALQAAATSPLTMTSFRLGTGSNYVPDPSQTALVGTTVYTGLPGHPLLENQNTLKYPLYIGDSVGPITYGEIGLFYNNTLYAICVYEVLLTKLPLDPVQNVGGASVTDFYVPIVSDNYEMYANTTQANTYKASVLASVADLPYSTSTTTNFFVIQGQPRPFLAFTDRVGEWNFSDWRAQGDKAVLGGDLSTLIIARAPDFYVTEKMIVQVTSGQDFGLCRQTTSVTTNGNNDLVIGLDRPLGRHISVGEKVTIFSNTNELFFGGSF